MRCRLSMLAAAAALGVGLLTGAAWAQGAGQSDPALAPAPGCHFGEVIDGSTAEVARRKIESAGFSGVHALKKSCDNFWHGKAILSGRPVNVVLSPTGKVMLESD